jgi:hypothetical protein
MSSKWRKLMDTEMYNFMRKVEMKSHGSSGSSYNLRKSRKKVIPAFIFTCLSKKQKVGIVKQINHILSYFYIGTKTRISRN